MHHPPIQPLSGIGGRGSSPVHVARAISVEFLFFVLSFARSPSKPSSSSPNPPGLGLPEIFFGRGGTDTRQMALDLAPLLVIGSRGAHHYLSPLNHLGLSLQKGKSGAAPFSSSFLFPLSSSSPLLSHATGKDAKPLPPSPRPGAW